MSYETRKRAGIPKPIVCVGWLILAVMAYPAISDALDRGVWRRVDPRTIPLGLPDDLVCKSAAPYSPCEAASVVAGELWVYAPQYRSACDKEPTYPDLVDCLSRHLWGVPFGSRKHYSPPNP